MKNTQNLNFCLEFASTTLCITKKSNLELLQKNCDVNSFNFQKIFIQDFVNASLAG